MGIEIERKFLVSGDGWRMAAHEVVPMAQGYLNDLAMALVDAVALADAFERTDALPEAFAAYTWERRRHLAAYHRYSRWLTPLFQSGHDTLARMRDLAFLPFGRLPLARTHMLRVLSGTQQGWLGRYGLQPGFLDVLRRSPPAG